MSRQSQGIGPTSCTKDRRLNQEKLHNSQCNEHSPAWRDLSRNLSQDGQTPRTSVIVVPGTDQKKNVVGTTSSSPNESSSKAVDVPSHKLYLGRPEKKKLMDELFIYQDDAYKSMSATAMRIFLRKQGNIKPFELCERSQKVPCQYWLKYMSAGHLYCECEKSFARRSRNQVSRLAKLRWFFVCVEEELWARSSLWPF